MDVYKTSLRNLQLPASPIRMNTAILPTCQSLMAAASRPAVPALSGGKRGTERGRDLSSCFSGCADAAGFQLLPRRWVVERTPLLAQSKPPLGKGFRGVDREGSNGSLHRRCATPHQEISLTVME